MRTLWMIGVPVAVLAGVAGALWLSQPTDTAPAPLAASTPQPVSVSPQPQVSATAPSSAEGSDTIELRAPTAKAAAGQARHELWQAKQLRESALADGTPQYHTDIDTAWLSELSVGQELVMGLPGVEQPVRVQLDSTHNNAGVPVWQGALPEGSEIERMTLVRGALETHISVTTLQGTYSVIIDNRSGRTVVTNENDLARRADPHGDTVELPAGELPPPVIPANS